MLFERLTEKRTIRQLAHHGPYFFQIDEDADPGRPASWKLRSTKNAGNLSMDSAVPGLFGEDPESAGIPSNEEPPEGPGIWHVDLVPLDTAVPCPGGMFYPLLFMVTEANEKMVELHGAVLLSPADDLESCTAECFRNTLEQAAKPPKTVVFSHKASFESLLSECTSRGMEIFKNPSHLPYTKWLVDDMADLPRQSFHKVFGIQSGEPRVAKVRIELQNAHPRIYRDLRLPGDTTLVQLHYYIQNVFDWHNSHLYDFSINQGRKHSLFPKFGSGDEGLPSELAATLQSLYEDGIKKLTYVYDYGDDWTHKITIRSLTPPKDGEPAPALIGGSGAAPPEDSGGIYEYCYLRQQIENGEIKPDPEDFEDWMLKAIADASFEFTGETPLDKASNVPPPQNHQQHEDDFWGF
jgi:hypothetical protein